MGTIVLVLVCWFLWSVGCVLLAQRKHRSAGGWFVLSLVFGVFAFIVMLFLPELPDPTMRNCPHCLSRIPLGARVCAHCQRDIPAVAPNGAAFSPASDEVRRNMFKGVY